MKFNKVEGGIAVFLVLVVVYIIWQLIRAPWA